MPLKTIYIENITVHASTERDASMQIWPSYKEMWLIKQYSFNEHIKLNLAAAPKLMKNNIKECI